MQYTTAVKATVTYKSGRHIEIEPPQAESLFFSIRAKYDEEGYRSWKDKLLHILGGRNEFEKARQKKIIDWLKSSEKSGRKRVLIIGDSIRMRLADSTGYGLHAYKYLIDHFNLTHIPHNTGGTKGILVCLENWLSCQPDIVHFNVGLHDLVLNPKGDKIPPSYNSIDQYVANLEKIVDMIKSSNVQSIIWGTNTPVQDEWHRYRPRSKKDRKVVRTLADVIEYNKAAEEVMKRHNIEINDMFKAIMDAGLEDCLLPDGVHLSYKGSVVLGKLVADKILRYE